MPPLPAHVLACPGSVELILRALRGELPQGNLYDAWDAWDKLPGVIAFKSTEEARIWLHTNWREIMLKPAAAADADLPAIEQAGSKVIPTTPTITHAREVWEDWMPQFFTTFVATGGNITKAMQAAGKCRDTFYEHRDNNRLFYEAYLLAREEANDRLRSTLDDRGVVGWEEPVFGRVGKDQDGIVGTVKKYDSSVLRLLASVHLPEFRAAKEAAGTNISINNSASANAEATATAKSGPAKLKDLQARKRKQLEKAARRSLIPKN